MQKLLLINALSRVRAKPSKSSISIFTNIDPHEETRELTLGTILDRF